MQFSETLYPIGSEAISIAFQIVGKNLALQPVP